MEQQTASLVDKCLIATPAIKDPIFSSSLVYMCEHNENGSMGLVVNHETSQILDDVFQQLDIHCDDEAIKNQPVYIGGPVQLEQGFVLHSGDGRWQKKVRGKTFGAPSNRHSPNSSVSRTTSSPEETRDRTADHPRIMQSISDLQARPGRQRRAN